MKAHDPKIVHTKYETCSSNRFWACDIWMKRCSGIFKLAVEWEEIWIIWEPSVQQLLLPSFRSVAIPVWKASLVYQGRSNAYLLQLYNYMFQGFKCQMCVTNWNINRNETFSANETGFFHLPISLLDEAEPDVN